MQQALQRLLLTNRVPAEATSNAFWGCGVDMRVVKRSTPEDLFSNRIEGKNFLGWILALIHAEKMGNFYWLPLLKKLPSSMVDGFQEVKEILAEKGLTHCPPIARSDLEDGTSANNGSSSSSSTRTSASTSSGHGGEVVVLPPRAKSERGAVMMGLDPRDLQILQMVEANSVCTLFEYYKLGLSMGVPHDVLTQNATKVHRMEMLVAARQMNSHLDVPDFFCD